MDDKLLKELREKVEAEEKRQYAIFLDLDGVLVDFESRMEEYVKKSKLMKFGIPYNSWDQFKNDLTKYYLENNPRDKTLKKAQRHATGSLWKLSRNDEGFWTGMEWMPDGRQLWDYCLSLRQKGIIGELNILSSPSQDQFAESGKRKWLEQEGLTPHLDQIIIVKDKFKYATGQKDILIDDTVKKALPWEEKGGTAILHKSAEDSIAKLRRELGI